jgi:inner membrane protein
METVTSLNLLERLNRWIQESIMVKLFSIGILMLILLIPSSWIHDLIYERQQRADDVINEVTSKWSGTQTISGPVLVIPYLKQEKIDKGKDGIEIREYVQKAFFLPEQLDIKGEVTPQILHRGIFDAVVYESALQTKSTFHQPDFKALNIPDDKVLWQDAHLAFGITDLRGINENPTVTVGQSTLMTEPSNNLGLSVNRVHGETDYTNDHTNATSAKYTHYSNNGIISKLNWQNKENFNGNVSIKLSLKGSKGLNFIPVGKTTTVNLSGAWNDPSFDGEFLPVSREITQTGFNATWKVLHFNRPFSQQWSENDQQLSGADFGVNLLIPVDQYQKSIRTSKYGALIILLTFVALFLVEITQKIRIHPFQYILIGVALTIYYTLLLSFSEHFGYNVSYIISSLATVILISLYSTTFFPKRNLAILFTGVLLTFYTFIYVIILQQDFSLLLGSIGLFMIIGLLMYFSRNINWYKQSVPEGRG